MSRLNSSPELTLSGEDVNFSSANTSERQIDFGLAVGANESDSLFDLATLPGVLVREVIAGGRRRNRRYSHRRCDFAHRQLAYRQTRRPCEHRADSAAPRPSSLRYAATRQCFLASVIAKPSTQHTTLRASCTEVTPLATRAGYTTQLLTPLN